MITPLSRYIALCLPLFATLGLQAQTPPPPPVPLVQVTFKAVAIGRGIADLGYMQQGKKVRFYPANLTISQNLTYKGPQELEFIQTQKIDGIPQEVPVAKVTFPPDIQKALVLFVPLRGQPVKYSALAIPNSETESPANSVRVINYSGRILPISLNGDRAILQPNEIKVVQTPKSELSVLIPRVLKETADQPDVCEATYHVPEGGRMTLLIAPRARGDKKETENVIIYDLAEDPAPRKSPTAPGTP
jgi:hypothetical protein